MANVRRVNLVGRETSKSRRKREASQKGLDPHKDFDQPTRRDPEQMDAEELRADNPAAEMPSRIVNGLMAVSYVKPHFEVEKDNRRVALEFSLELTEDHDEVLPKKICDEWEHLKEGGCRLIDVIGVTRQHFDVRLVPDDKESDLECDAPIEKIKLQSIEDKGTGESKNIIRLSFRLVCDLTQNVERFACRNFGKTVWLKMAAVQGEMF